MLTTRSQRPRRTRSTTVGRSPSSATLRTYSTASPAAASVAGRAPGREQLEAEPGERLRPPGTSAALSSSRTERKAVPLAGSRRPAARSALANAVGRSEALAITSPVERISGPSTGSAARESARTAAPRPSRETCSGGRSVGSPSSASFAPAARRQAACDEVHAGRLARERHRPRGPRVRLEHVDLALGDARAGR